MNKQNPGPCPFCGHAVTDVTKFSADGDYRARCWSSKCSAFGPVKPTEAEAIAAWDAPGEKIAALVGACRLALADYERIGSWPLSASSLEAMRAATD